MRVTIGQLDDGPEALEPLRNWLLDDPELAFRAEILTSYRPSPEGMGGVIEALDVILTHSEALAGLALSYAAWRSQNSRSASVKISVDDRSLIDRSGSEGSVREITMLGSDHGTAESATGESTGPDSD